VTFFYISDSTYELGFCSLASLQRPSEDMVEYCPLFSCFTISISDGVHNFVSVVHWKCYGYMLHVPWKYWYLSLTVHRTKTQNIAFYSEKKLGGKILVFETGPLVSETRNILVFEIGHLIPETHQLTGSPNELNTHATDFSNTSQASRCFARWGVLNNFCASKKNVQFSISFQIKKSTGL